MDALAKRLTLVSRTRQEVKLRCEIFFFAYERAAASATSIDVGYRNHSYITNTCLTPSFVRVRRTYTQ